MRARPGFFLTIEGIEGSGKSTLAEALAKKIGAVREVVATQEPGGGGLGDNIRQMLLDTSNEIPDRTELLLFEAARAYHVNTRIVPALNRGAVVICDRFTDSTFAYQGYARKISLDVINWLNDYATAGLKPDLTILLDLDPAEGLSRQKGIDRISGEEIEFHKRVRQGYLAIAGHEPDRFSVIDAGKSFEEVLRQAEKALLGILY